jgi:hypothetical protein
MVASRDLSSALLKVDVAKERLAHVEETIRGYIQGGVAEVERVPATQPGLFTARVKGNPKPLPPQLQGDVADTAHNLGYALNHLAAALVGSAADENTDFPIYRWSGPPAVQKLEQNVRRRLKGTSPAVIGAVIGMELYENGKGDALWRLHQVDVVDKHRWSVHAVFNQRSVIFDAKGMFRSFAKSGKLPPVPEGLPKMPIGVRPKCGVARHLAA